MKNFNNQKLRLNLGPLSGEASGWLAVLGLVFLGVLCILILL